MSDPAYLAYIEAPAHAMYTQDHLENVTFEASFQLFGELPKSSPPNSLLQYMFTKKAPETGHSKQSMPFIRRKRLTSSGKSMKKCKRSITSRTTMLYISTKWLLRLILSGGQKARSLYRVQRIGTTTFHILAILENGNYVCDCCMGSNAGIPCRHFFQVMLKVHTVKFKIGFIHPRYVT
ncbi:hypothetical protein BJ165DRAFT_503630 [Panaeolus papilionaceus]|nr:hypothetical protein BJ165DRAFT_503630 [Panaeolus papilionaceus]